MKTCSPDLEIREEKVNAITHVVGILFGLVSVPFLILNACKTCGHFVITGISIYGLSFLMVFTCSTLFHFQKPGKTREFFKILDHISIYFFIAGTYTPFILIFVNNSFGLTLLAILWVLAIAGTIFKTFYCGRFEIISTLVYLGMGWMLLTGGCRCHSIHSGCGILHLEIVCLSSCGMAYSSSGRCNLSFRCGS
jgi:hemolysin III